MSTETHTSTHEVPDFTILRRVASIPLVCSGLETINGALSSHVLTRQPYHTAKGLSTTAYRYSEPFQIRFAPLIERADGIANKAVDAVESRYPYPFKAKPEDVASLVREGGQSAINVANKAIDENITSPAKHMAEGIDHQFAPIVDYFEVAVTRLNCDTSAALPHHETKYQYQRALMLSKTLKDNIYVYSNEQLKQLHVQSAIVNRASETAQAISQLASSSITNAQKRINELSDTMLHELQKLQASLQSTASCTLHDSTSQIQARIPPQIQQAYNDVSSHLTAAVSELSSIMTTKDLPLQEKVGRVGKEVREQISPLLETIRKRLSDLLASGRAEASAAAHSSGGAVGNGKQEK